MAGWIDRQIDRYVDKQLDAFLQRQMPDEDFQQLKAMTRNGQPLDKTVHNGVAKVERINGKINRVTRVLP